MPRIKVLSPSFAKNTQLRLELSQHFSNVVYHTEKHTLNPNEIAPFLCDADGAIIGTEHIDHSILSQLPKLKILAKYGVGLDNVDAAACRAQGVTLGWSPGLNRRSVAEMTLAFMLSLTLNLYLKSLLLKQGIWDKNGGRQLTGKTIGIIGLGHIGQELVRLLQPFNCTILVNDIVDITEFCTQHNLKEAPKDVLYAQADILSIHTPLTTLTHHLINANALSKMKSTAFLINTARGHIVDIAALKHALTTHQIAGAALDVYPEEPPNDREFLALPNLFCTPHIGANNHESVLAMGRSAIGHLVDFFSRQSSQ